ncbi:MAG: M23 family metallopeptidase [bacterium]
MIQTIEKLIKQIAAAPKRSNPVSAVLRILFEKKSSRKFLGSQLIALTMVSSIVALPTHAFDYEVSHPQFVDGSSLIPVTTETTYVNPAIRELGISQKYGKFHPGIDIRAPRGSDIIAIADGVVIEATYVANGYGKHVRILHEGNVITLSAHMDQMTVKAGEKVTKGQKIGIIGMTGWTTGPHLHFEVSQDGKYLDPLQVVQ